MACSIVGDSIALDLQLEVMHECGVNAKKGIPSAATIGRVPSAHVDTLIISVGSNDPGNARLRQNLEAIRACADAARVIWILPIDPRARLIAQSVAAAHGDHVVTFIAAGGGAGVTYGPSFVLGGHFASGELVAVLPDHRTSDLAIHAVYPTTRHVSLKLRCFIDHLAASFGG